MGKIAITDHRTKPAKGWQRAAERMLEAHTGHATGTRTEMVDANGAKIAVTKHL